MAYKLTRKAEEDLIAIYLQGVTTVGSAQAESYHAQLDQVFRFLPDNPRAARGRFEISPPVRCHPYVRVRHSREDWDGDPV